MADRLAIIAGRGALPLAVARARPDALFVTVANVDGVTAPAGMSVLETRFEHLGSLFGQLHAEGIGEVVFAGAMERPRMDAAALDAPTLALLPRIQGAIAARDDGLLRAMIAMFEEHGLQVRGAHEMAPELLVQAGMALGGAVGAPARADMLEAQRLLDALAPLDLGQSLVVEAGQCLGVETLQGTDALLDFVARTPERLRRGGGVLVKMPKQGQEIRADMPVVGPGTVAGVARAGLAGLAVAAGGVIMLERAQVVDLVTRHGLFMVAL